MSPDLKRELLATERLGEFLKRLRGPLRLQQAADLLSPHGGPNRRAAVLNYETGSRGLSSKVQLAYVRAFDLDADLALHLQRLAGEAAGPALPVTLAMTG